MPEFDAGQAEETVDVFQRPPILAKCLKGTITPWKEYFESFWNELIEIAGGQCLFCQGSRAKCGSINGGIDWMLLDQRRNGILEIIEKNGFASLRELADRISASESTVRRDLEYLENIGQVRRTRGGAAYVGESLTGFDDRRNLALREKQKIGRRVAELIGQAETIILDGGTTTLEVARHLTGKSLQVVTNSLPIVNHLVGVPGIELVFLGGYLYPKTGVALGGLTVSALRQIQARRLIMGVGGITEAGLFNSNSLLVEAERQMMAAADEVIIVTDSGKLGHSELARLCSLDDVQRLVVDAGITPEWKMRLQSHGIEVIVADED